MPGSARPAARAQLGTVASSSAGPAVRARPAPATTPGALRGGPAYRAATQQTRRPGTAAQESRTHFVLLVVGLLGGSLLCLLLINTVLATGSFRISALEQGNVTLAQQVKSLQAKVAAEESPFSLAARAHALGMVEPHLLHFLNLTTGRVVSEPSQMPGVPAVPGYSP